MERRPSVGLMLAHRLRRWGNIKPTLVERLVFAAYRALCLFYLKNTLPGYT